MKISAPCPILAFIIIGYNIIRLFLDIIGNLDAFSVAKINPYYLRQFIEKFNKVFIIVYFFVIKRIFLQETLNINIKRIF